MAATTEVALVFQLTTEPREGHPHPEYAYCCEVTYFGDVMWRLWGKSSEEAEKAARFEIRSRTRRTLRGF